MFAWRFPLVTIVSPLLFLALVGCGKSEEPAPRTVELYERYCSRCHESGAANAPRRGDPEAWKIRQKKGRQALLSSIEKGMVAMPPKGECKECKKDDFRALLDYLAR